MVGKAYLEYNGHKFYLGAITNVTETVQKKTGITPVVTKGMQRAFPIETGNSHSYDLNFTRKNPANAVESGTDSTKWSNAYWYKQLTVIMDRWQARTDGFMLYYEEDNTNPNFPSFSAGGYVKSLSRTYNQSLNEVITGTLSFTVGRMRLNSDGTIPSGAVNFNSSETYILISDPSETSTYVLYRGNEDESQVINLVSSVEITAGSESPFESVTIKIPKRKLKAVAPNLTFVDGRNKITMKFMGNHLLTLNRAKTSKDTITLRAYCNAQVLGSRATPEDWEYTPFQLIKQCVQSLGFSESNVSGDRKLITNVTEKGQAVRLPKGTNIWRAMNICAIYLGAKLFFADNNMYLVRYADTMTSNECCKYLASINPYSYAGSVGEVEIDEEGADPVVNRVFLACTAPVETGDEYTTADGDTFKTTRIDGINTDGKVDVKDESSIATYTEHKVSMTVPELVNGDVVRAVKDETTGEDGEITYHPVTTSYRQGEEFASNYISFLTEPQRSVTFSVKEGYAKQGQSGIYWLSFLGPSARTDSIYDRVSDETVDNRSTKIGESGSVPQKLVLSSYTRQYPKCICEYTFGIIANVDLSTYVSKTNNSLG